MSAAWLIASGLIGLLAGAGGAVMMLGRARRGSLPVDLPDPRRLHLHPTPRGGGIGIALAGVAALPLAAATGSHGEFEMLTVIVLSWAVPNALIGTIDDHRPLPTTTKLAVQIAAATAAAILGLRVEHIALPPLGTIELGLLGVPFSVVWLVWMANVFNFMDGMDALASECGAIFFAGLAAAALLTGADGHGALALAVAGSLLGFLRYNAPPASIFMGDVGSLFAGAVMGGLALALSRGDVAGVPLLASALIVGSFAFDATFTVVRRALRGLALRPHRTHFYQRLALAGWAHRRVRVLYVGLTLACVAAGLAVIRGGTALQLTALAVVSIGLVSTVPITRRAERRARIAQGQRT